MPSPEMFQAQQLELAHFVAAGLDRLPFGEEILRAAMPDLPPACPAGTVMVPATLPGVSAIWIVSPGVSADRRIVYVHGGGFIAGSLGSHGNLAGWLGSAAGAALLFVDYTRSPEAHYPVQLDEIDVALDWALLNGPDGPAPSITLWLAGDSAGAGMALAAMVRRRSRGATLPAAAALLCGMYDIDSETSAFIRASSRRAHMVAAYLGADGSPTDPLACPIRADLSGLPPLAFQTGSEDGCLEDNRALAARSMAAGVETAFTIREGAFHVWHRFAPNVPEAIAALREAARFLADHP